MDMKEIMKRFDNSTFCYAKPGGQGFVDKSECSCTLDYPCQARIDHDRFFIAFNEVAYGDFNKRAEVIEKIKPEFKESQWWKDNVIE